MDDRLSDLHRAEQLLAEGKLSEAASIFARILAVDPQCAEALFQLGTLALKSGDPRAAIPLLQRAAAAAPTAAIVWNNLGAALKESGDRAGAASAWQSAVVADPKNSQALANLAELAQEQGDCDLAAKLYGQCLESNPSDVESAVALGDILLDRSQYLGAEECFLLAHRLDYARDDHGERIRLLSQLALARLKQDKLASAEGLYRLIISQMPSLAGMWANLAYVLERQGRIDEAIESARQSLALEPGLSMGINNLAVALRAAHRIEEAAAGLESAFATGFNQPLARFNHATIRLQQERYQEGWDGYEQRHAAFGPDIEGTGVPRLNRQRLTAGTLEGKTILVRTEQGYGDTLQFCRFLPALAERSGAKLLWECPEELRPLATEAIGSASPLAAVAEFVPVGGPFPAHDSWILLGSLPGLLNLTLDEIRRAAVGQYPSAGASVPYLQVGAERRVRWQARLDAVVAERLGADAAGLPRVGLVWQGNPNQSQDIHRSCPLRHFRPLLQQTDVVWVSVQKGEVGERQLVGCTQPNLISLGAELQDFADTGAVLAGLDLLITVDTSVAHLAGSLGLDVWCLLCRTPDWRWHLNRADCPWYPTMTLFRQPKFGDWNSVIIEVEKALGDRLSQASAKTRRAVA